MKVLALIPQMRTQLQVILSSLRSLLLPFRPFLQCLSDLKSNKMAVPPEMLLRIAIISDTPHRQFVLPVSSFKCLSNCYNPHTHHVFYFVF